MVFLGKISRSYGLSPSFLGGGGGYTIKHKKNKSAPKMVKKENSGKNKSNFGVVWKD